MAMVQEKIKLTGYADIDALLLQKQSFFKDNEELEKQIEIAVKVKPINPFSKSNATKFKWIKIISSK